MNATNVIQQVSEREQSEREKMALQPSYEML